MEKFYGGASVCVVKVLSLLVAHYAVVYKLVAVAIAQR